MSHCCLKGDAAERQSVVNGYEQNAKNEIKEVELTCSVQDVCLTIQQASDAAGERVTLLCGVQFSGSG